MVPELTPANNRAAISGVATAFNWTVAFVVTFSFEPLQEMIKPYGAYLVFMSFTVIGVAILLGKQCLLSIPERRHRPKQFFV